MWLMIWPAFLHTAALYGTWNGDITGIRNGFLRSIWGHTTEKNPACCCNTECIPEAFPIKRISIMWLQATILSMESLSALWWTEGFAARRICNFCLMADTGLWSRCPGTWNMDRNWLGNTVRRLWITRNTCLVLVCRTVRALTRKRLDFGCGFFVLRPGKGAAGKHGAVRTAESPGKWLKKYGGTAWQEAPLRQILLYQPFQRCPVFFRGRIPTHHFSRNVIRISIPPFMDCNILRGTVKNSW